MLNSTEVRARIEKYLPEARRELLAQISAVVVGLGLPLYLVGGFVRDVLLDLTPDDFDMVVEGSAPKLARAMARALGGQVREHSPFGTATWTNVNGEEIDFASARRETYSRPAALPTVATPASIAEDLRRRDFTFNTLAVRVDGEHFGELLDPFGGQADLTAGMVRVLHPHSFVDDPTRLFRAVRYEQRLGFQIAPETLALIPGAWQSLTALSPDRVRHEFELIFREASVIAILERLQALDILRHVHPVLHWDAEASRRAEALATLPIVEWRLSAPLQPDALYLTLLLGHVSYAEATQALTRLNANRAVFDAVLAALTLEGGWARPSEAVAALEGLSELALGAAYVLHGRPELSSYLSEWRFVRATTTGDDLLARGLQPGPQFKQLLWKLRAARLDGIVRDDSEEKALLEKLIRDHVAS